MLIVTERKCGTEAARIMEWYTKESTKRLATFFECIIGEFN